MIFRLLFALTLFLPISVLAAEKEGAPEKLNVSVPKDWKVAHQAQSKDGSITELVPSAEGLENWTRMITIQALPSPDKYEPEAFINAMAELAKKACADVQVIPVRNDQQNGFPFSQKIIACTKNQATGVDEMMHIKAIRGDDSFYVVQVANRTGMSRVEVVRWAIYLRDAAVSPQQ
jgi:hypothetical protein